MDPLFWLLKVGGWLKSALAWLWSVVTTYPRTSLAILAVVVAWFAHGWDLDRKLDAQRVELTAAFNDEKLAAAAAFDKAAAEERAEVAALAAEQDKINLALKARLAAERAAADARLRDALAKVPAYVTPLADSRCVVPVGFLRLAADGVRAANGDQGPVRPDAAEALPEEAMGLVDRASNVPLSAVADWQTRILATGEAWRKRALTCDRWVDEQSALFNARKDGDP